MPKSYPPTHRSAEIDPKIQRLIYLFKIRNNTQLFKRIFQRNYKSFFTILALNAIFLPMLIPAALSISSGIVFAPLFSIIYNLVWLGIFTLGSMGAAIWLRKKRNSSEQQNENLRTTAMLLCINFVLIITGAIVSALWIEYTPNFMSFMHLQASGLAIAFLSIGIAGVLISLICVGQLTANIIKELKLIENEKSELVTLLSVDPQNLATVKEILHQLDKYDNFELLTAPYIIIMAGYIDQSIKNNPDARASLKSYKEVYTKIAEFLNDYRNNSYRYLLSHEQEEVVFPALRDIVVTILMKGIIELATQDSIKNIKIDVITHKIEEIIGEDWCTWLKDHENEAVSEDLKMEELNRIAQEWKEKCRDLIGRNTSPAILEDIDINTIHNPNKTLLDVATIEVTNDQSKTIQRLC